MQPVNATPATPVATPTPTAAKPDADVRAGSGVQGVIGDLIRGSVAGYQATTRQTAVQADKASIYPFETVSTATSLLKQKTANVKFVGKATGLLHTIGGFALLIAASNVSSSLKSPGDSAVDLGNRVADAIDGRRTAEGWNLGWGIRSGEESAESAPVGAPVEQSTIGSALSALGMK